MVFGDGGMFVLLQLGEFSWERGGEGKGMEGKGEERGGEGGGEGKGSGEERRG